MAIIKSDDSGNVLAEVDVVPSTRDGCKIIVTTMASMNGVALTLKEATELANVILAQVQCCKDVSA